MANKLIPGLRAAIALQLIPKRLAQKAQADGRDLIALGDSVDRILMEFNYPFTSTLSDNQMDGAIKTLFSGMRDRVLAFITSGMPTNAHLRLFMNDANHQQDYWGRLRQKTSTYARGVRDAYDPNGLFGDKTGGFKL